MSENKKFPIINCCDVMIQQLNYVCDKHPGQSCPRQIVKCYKDKENKIIQIGFCDISDFSNNVDGCINYDLNYCPWCGTNIQNHTEKQMKKILIESFPYNEKYIYDLEEFQNGIEHGIILKYSDLDKEWSLPNQECIKYVDTGDGVQLTFLDQTILIPYSHLHLIGFVIQYKKSQEKIKSTLKVLTLQEEENNEF